MKHPLQRYTFKGEWASTALKFYVMAKDEDDAKRKAENYIRRLEGGQLCFRITPIKAAR